MSGRATWRRSGSSFVLLDGLHFETCMMSPRGGATCGVAVLTRLCVDAWQDADRSPTFPGRAAHCRVRLAGIGVYECVFLL